MDFGFLLYLFDLASCISFCYVIFSVCSISFHVFGMDLTYPFMVFIGFILCNVRFLINAIVDKD